MNDDPSITDAKARSLGAHCERCYLRERREGAPVLPEINSGALCLAIGEAPGEREVEEGRPFVGPSGFEAERGFESAGVSRKRVSWANALCCRPKGNDLDRLLYDLKRENKQRIANKVEPIPSPQECCRPVMLSALRQYENIVTLGKVGYQSVTGSDHSIMAIRGFPIRGMLDDQGMFWTGFDESVCNKKLMPTIHPAFVLRAKRWTKTFRTDVARAVRWFTGQMRWVEPTIIYNPPPADLETFLLRRKHPFVVYDVETAPTLPAKEAHFDPLLDKLRCIGFGTQSEAMVVGFLSVDGVTKLYTEFELSEIIEIVRRFMRDSSIIKAGHNANYYDRMVIEHHLGVTPAPVVDTIALHKIADAEMPHNLGFVGSMLADVATAWKADHTATEASSDADLYRYNALDVVVNARIVEPLWASVQAVQGENCVRVLHKVQAACAGMHRNGMYVDEPARRAWDVELRAKAMFHKKKLIDAIGDHNFNPASYNQVKKILFERWNLQPVNYTETGEPSTDDETIRALILHKGLTDQQQVFLDSMRWFRRWTKFRGTYVRKLVSVNTLIERDELAEDTEDAVLADKKAKKKAKGQIRYGIVLPDGRMHADWNAHGTVGWRLSSSHPNCQNFPRRLRNMVIPAPGNVFVGADMDQLELRFVAALAGAKRYLEVFNAGGDPHSLSAELIFGDTFKSAEGETRKRIRDFSKCVIGSTRVLMPALGYVKIRDLMPKPMMAPGETAPLKLTVFGASSVKVATHFYFGGIQPVLKVTTESGYELSGTGKHQLMLENGTWKRLDALAVGDRLILPKVEFSHAIAYKKGSVQLFDLLTRLGICKKRLKRGEKTGQKKGKWDQNSSKILKVPDAIFESPKAVITAFLAGIFDTDGTFATGGWNVVSKSRNFVLDLKLLLDMVGIFSKIQPFWNSDYERYYYRLAINRGDSVIFNSVIAPDMKCSRKVAKASLESKGWVGRKLARVDSIQSIEPAGEEEVFDLVVPDGNDFVANGLVNHNTFTYAVIYGASDETVKETIASTEDKEGKLVYADITLRDTRNRKRAWLDGSPEIEKWWDSEIKLYQKQLYLAEPVLGLRRNFLDGEDRNEILNLRAQSGGKAVVHLAMIELLEGELPFQKWGPGTGLVHDGHDSLVFEVPEGEAERVKSIIESAMCRSVPGLPVKFTASAKIAKRWDHA